MSKTCTLVILALLTAGIATAEEAFIEPLGAQAPAVAIPETGLDQGSEEGFVTLADGCTQVATEFLSDSFVIEVLRQGPVEKFQASSLGPPLEGCFNCRLIAVGARCCGCNWRNTGVVCKTAEGTRGVLQTRICSWVRTCPQGQTCEIEPCHDCQPSGYRCV